VDIADLNPTRVASARTRGRLVALVDCNRLDDRLAFEVLERDVARVASAASEGFDAGAVFGVHHGDVFYEDVGHNVFSVPAYWHLLFRLASKLLIL